MIGVVKLRCEIDDFGDSSPGTVLDNVEDFGQAEGDGLINGNIEN